MNILDSLTGQKDSITGEPIDGEKIYFSALGTDNHPKKSTEEGRRDYVMIAIAIIFFVVMISVVAGGGTISQFFNP